jgi:hypothetical protein
MMKCSAIVDLVRSGKFPLVVLGGSPWDDAFGQKGMIARITVVREGSHGSIDLTFDYNGNLKHNLALQSHEWFIYKDGVQTGLGTVFEAGYGKMNEKNVTESVSFEPDDDIDVTLSKDDSLLVEYCSSSQAATMSYVEWLEWQVKDLRGQTAPQRQDALDAQLRDVIPLATRAGCYDAADVIRKMVEKC